MSEFGTNDASHELIPLYMYALTLPTNKEKKRKEKKLPYQAKRWTEGS